MVTLGRRPMLPCPGPFHGRRSDYISWYVDRLAPDVRVVEAFHRALFDYLSEPDPLFLVRLRERDGEVKHGVPLWTRAGIAIKPTDNAPPRWWHSFLWDGNMVGDRELRGLIEQTAVEHFQIINLPNIAKAGWHTAHIVDVSDRNTDWANWTRDDIVGRFVRNIHPANVFPVPMDGWQQSGSDADLIATVVAHYRVRYASIWDEFALLAGGRPHPAAPPDAVIELPPHPSGLALSTQPSTRAGGTPTPRGSTCSSDAAIDPWRYILDGPAKRTIGDILARDPRAHELTRQLDAGQSVARLVVIADALHNKCRPNTIERQAPGDLGRQARIGWESLFRGVGKRYAQPSGWTGAIRLLEADAETGLTTVGGMDIRNITRVGARIVTGPYSWANERGIR